MYPAKTRGGDVTLPLPPTKVSQTQGRNTSKPSESKARFVTLEGADHFYSTLMYDHQKELYTEMLDFLENDCGPGGL